MPGGRRKAAVTCLVEQARRRADVFAGMGAFTSHTTTAGLRSIVPRTTRSILCCPSPVSISSGSAEATSSRPPTAR